MWLACLLSVAWALAPLDVEVVADAAVRGPRPVSPGPRPAVSVQPAQVVVDGVLEPAWGDVRRAPPLTPLAGGPAPPGLRAKVAAVGGALVVASPEVPPGWTSTWVLDPTGTRARWVVVRLVDGEAHAEACTLVGQPEAWFLTDGEHAVPSRAVPCSPVPVDAVRGQRGWELQLPGDDLTSAAHLLWTVTGPEGAGGTWARGGKREPWPELGRGLAMGGPQVRLTTAPDGATGGWTVTVEVPDDTVAGSWRWRRTWLGETTHAEGFAPDEGVVEVVPGAAVDLTLPGVQAPDPWFELRDDTAPVPHAWVARLDARTDSAWMVTPVQGDVVQLRYAVSADRMTTITVRNRRGRALGAADVVLPAGTGVIAIARTWRGDAVRVVVDGLTPADGVAAVSAD